MAVVTRFPTTNAVVATGWTNPVNAYADDAVYATAAPAKSGSITSDFGGFGFDANIPVGSTINSVTVSVQWNVSTTGSLDTMGIQSYVGGVASGTEFTTDTLTTTDTTDTTSPTGLTRDNLLDASFKVRARATRAASNTAFTGSIDFISVTVDYTAPVAADPKAASDTLSLTTSESASVTTVVAPLLRWAPPDLVTPITINVGVTEASITLTAGQDYILQMPAAVKTGRLRIVGGRNVVVIGGHISLNSAATLGQAIQAVSVTGILHIEGLLIDRSSGASLDHDGIQLGSSTTTNNIVQVQNCRIIGLTGTAAGTHADVIQQIDGTELRVHRLTATSNYQGMFVRDSTADVLGKVVLEDVDIAMIEATDVSECIFMYSNATPGPFTTIYEYTNVYLDMPGTRTVLRLGITPNDLNAAPRTASQTGTTITWPGLTNITGSVQDAVPASPMVAAGTPGLTYVSPGYRSAVTEIASSDAIAVTLSESASVTTLDAKASSDTMTLIVTEAPTTVGTGATADTLTITSSETAAVFRASTTGDTLSLTVTESAAVARVSTTADAVSLSTSDTSAIDRFSTTADTLSFSVTESPSVVQSGDAVEAKASSDTAALSASEAPTIARVSTTADTVAVTSSESAALARTSSLADTASVGTGDVITLAHVSSITDTASLVTADAGAITATTATADTATVTTTETGTLVIVGAMSDAATIASTETVAVLVSDTKAASDTATITTTDVATLVAVNTLNVADTATITSVESGSVTTVDAKTSTDTATITSAEARSVTVTVLTADIVTVTAAESGTVVASASSVDAASITSLEGVTLAATITTGDAASLGLTEVAGLVALITFADGATLAVTEAATVSAETLPDLGAVVALHAIRREILFATAAVRPALAVTLTTRASPLVGGTVARAPAVMILRAGRAPTVTARQNTRDGIIVAAQRVRS